MDKEQVLAILRDHEPELKAAGLLHLCLFGSVARGDNTPASDVDLLAEYDRSNNPDLFGLVRIQDRLASLVGAPVHLSSAHLMRPRVRSRVLQESVSAF